MSLTAVSREEHAHKRWLRRASLDFAAGDTVLPLVADEVAVVAKSIPMGFVKHADDYLLVAIMGLAPNQNLLVSSEGHWLTKYMPAAYRTGPFRLATDAQGNLLLCVDETTNLIVDGEEGERFFDDDGNPTRLVSDTMDLLGRLDSGRKTVEKICTVLAKHNLIDQWDLSIGDQDIQGLYKVNETALNDLSDENFLELRQTGALPVVYSQLISMQNIADLIEIFRERAATQSYTASISETFSF